MAKKSKILLNFELNILIRKHQSSAKLWDFKISFNSNNVAKKESFLYYFDWNVIIIDDYASLGGFSLHIWIYILAPNRVSWFFKWKKKSKYFYWIFFI